MVPQIKNYNSNLKNNISEKIVSEVPKEYKEVATGMESQFADFLISEMRKTINKDEPESSASDFYESMLDNEYAQIMSKTRGGLGLQKVILDQIYPQQSKRPSIHNNVANNINNELRKTDYEIESKNIKEINNGQ